MSEKENVQTNLPERKKSGPMGGAMGGPMGMSRGGGKAKNFKASMGKLIKYLKPYAVWLTIALIFTAAATTLSILAPGYIRDITNEITKALMLSEMTASKVLIDMSKIASIGIILIIFYLTSLLLNFLQTFIMSGITQGVSKSLRTKISQKINKIPLKYFDSHNVGDTLSRVTNDVDTIGQTLNQSVATLFSSVIMLIGVLIAMFVTCWQLSLTAIVTVPLSVIIIMITVKFSQKYFVAQQRHLGTLNGQIEENYSGQSVVKAFNGEKKAKETFNKTNEKLFKSSKNSQFFSLLPMPIMSFISNLGFVAVCVIGGILFIDGKIDVGVITSFFIYIRLFQNPMVQISQAAGNLQHAAAAAERVFEFLEEKEQEDESRKTTLIKDVKGKVEFKNVKFGYDENRIIIKDFSANVKPGQKVAIVGPTGAGKTTMINLLMRFYEINDGQIFIDDVPINEMKREDVRNLFGMVLQDTWLFNGTIKENIIYSKQNVSDEEVIKACEAANIDHFIRTLPNGYDMILEDDSSISSGQKQLLTIARAMVQNSPMLILDEATSNVDTRTEQLIQDAMDKVTKGRTSFVIAHRLSTIKNADLILVMKNGDIIESGNHTQLIEQQGFYYDLYNSQFVLTKAEVVNSD